MNCDCVDKVNKRLAEAGHEYKLAMSLVFDDKMNMSARLALPTVWNDPLKRVGRKKKEPPTMLCTLCPFCGVATAPATATAEALQQEEARLADACEKGGGPF